MIISLSGYIGTGKDTVGKIISIILNNPQLNEKGILNFYNKNVGQDRDWQIKKFADKLKDMVCILIGCTREQLEDRDFKEKELGEEWWYWKIESGNSTEEPHLVAYSSDFSFIPHYDAGVVKLTPRKLLQILGTNYSRKIIHPNIWVNALMSEYVPIKNPEVSRFLESENLPDSMNGGEEVYPNWVITDTRFPNELRIVKDKGGISIRVSRQKEERDKASSLEHISETALNMAKFDYEIQNDGTIEDLIVKVKEILTQEKLIK